MGKTNLGVTGTRSCNRTEEDAEFREAAVECMFDDCFTITIAQRGESVADAQQCAMKTLRDHILWCWTSGLNINRRPYVKELSHRLDWIGEIDLHTVTLQTTGREFIYTFTVESSNVRAAQRLMTRMKRDGLTRAEAVK